MSKGSLPEELSTKQSLVEALNRERNALYTALRGLGEKDLRQPNAVDLYSVADLCGLLSAWESRLLTLIQQISQGDVNKIHTADLIEIATIRIANALNSDDPFNDTQRRKRSRWSWREILNEMVLTREEIGWTLANMPEPALFAQQPLNVSGRGVIHCRPADIVRQIMLHDRYCTQKITVWRMKKNL
jgi:hypothetical protein